MDSILDSTKKYLGVELDYEQFDPDIIMSINSTFAILNQMGIGSEECFSIEDSGSSWSDFTDNPKLLGMVKPYMYLRVKKLFDPPYNSTLVQAIDKELEEFEYRMCSEYPYY